jgi:hypothetical protein
LNLIIDACPNSLTFKVCLLANFTIILSLWTSSHECLDMHGLWHLTIFKLDDNTSVIPNYVCVKCAHVGFIIAQLGLFGQKEIPHSKLFHLMKDSRLEYLKPWLNIHSSLYIILHRTIQRLSGYWTFNSMNYFL